MTCHCLPVPSLYFNSVLAINNTHVPPPDILTDVYGGHPLTTDYTLTLAAMCRDLHIIRTLLMSYYTLLCIIMILSVSVYTFLCIIMTLLVTYYTVLPVFSTAQPSTHECSLVDTFLPRALDAVVSMPSTGVAPGERWRARVWWMPTQKSTP